MIDFFLGTLLGLFVAVFFIGCIMSLFGDD